MIEIRAPIWGGGKPKLGIATFRVGDGLIQVKITYTRKDGRESYPGHYEMDSNKLKKYPIQIVRGGVQLYVAPLDDWEYVASHAPGYGVKPEKPEEPEEDKRIKLL